MDIEHNENLSDENLENDEIKNDLSAPNVVSNATRVPDRRLVCLVVASTYSLV